MMTNLFLSFFGISVSVGVVAAVLMLLAPFLAGRYAAKWKYFIWIFLAVRLLIPFSGADGRLAADMLPQMRTVSETEEESVDTKNDGTIPYRRITVEIPAQMTAPITAQSGKDNSGISMLDIVAFVWAVGGLIFLSAHLISYFHYRWQVMKSGKMVEDVDILGQMFKLRRELRIRRTIRVIEYPQAGSPMIMGFINSVLVLPSERYSVEELYFILKHELIHLKRGDLYCKLLFAAANAVHWFNPLIWIMQKEAAVDMEMSCDERVTQGADYAVRKAYTEILLSVLHKQCARKSVFTTQFYGGTKIMKRRFKNILAKKRKKNGICIVICAVFVTTGLGMLVGCSAAGADTEKAETGEMAIGEISTGEEDTGDMPDQSEWEAVRIEPIPVEDSSAESGALEDTATLTFTKEGEEEQKQAVLAVGDGYSLYLPEDEWQAEGPDTWRTAANEQVRLWVTHFEGGSPDSVNQELEADGYVTEEEYHKWKQEGDLIFHVRLKASENDVWGIFYTYPAEAEEGWGRELPVIADTFALSVGADEE